MRIVEYLNIKIGIKTKNTVAKVGSTFKELIL